MKRLLVIFIVFFALHGSAQTVLDWNDLQYGISWKNRNPDSPYPSFYVANFSEKMEELEGQKISITGYLLVLDGNQSLYMLSKYPMASCFFCGGGGPETVVEILFSKNNSFDIDDVVTVTGTLRLNEDDPSHSYYRIERAEGFKL